MKSTGIVRKVDELGRIVLPIELRRSLNIDIKDSLEIFVEDDGKIVLQKYNAGCVFTNSMDGLINYQGTKVSKQAVMEMAQLAGLHIANDGTTKTNL